MSDVYSYSDYRTFIKEHYDRNKAADPRFSYRVMARKAGINSAPFFKFVIEGKRNVGKKTLQKICAALDLKEREAEYFENLVGFNQAETATEKSLFFDKLIGLQRVRKIPALSKDRMEYFQEWYHCVIRELVTLADFGGDYGKLGRMLNPPIPPAKAEASVDLLLDLGFLEKVDGRFVQAEPTLTSGIGAQEPKVIRHQVKMMQLAIEGFERFRAEERMVSSTTMGISQATFRRVVGKFRDFNSHVMEIVTEDQRPERVYQLTVSLTPLTQVQGVRP